MASDVVAAVKTAPSQMELRSFPFPRIDRDSAVMRVDAAGVCGSDVAAFATDRHTGAVMGHENVGRIAEIGDIAARAWGVGEGDAVVLEEYLACGWCHWCRQGEYRLCKATDTAGNPDALRFGSTSVQVAPSLWGGYSEYLYLPFGSVVHRLPDGVPPEIGALALPLANGFQWACMDAGAGPGKSVLIMGPGQQGLGCAVASIASGADQVIVSGLSRDARRLATALKLGADHVVDVDDEGLVDAVMEATSGRGVDVVVDTTSARSDELLRHALAVLVRKGGALVVQGSGNDSRGVPVAELAKKYVTVTAARGHSYASVERALRTMELGRFDLSALCTHRLPLREVGEALRIAGGQDASEAIHVTVDPWA